MFSRVPMGAWWRCWRVSPMRNGWSPGFTLALPSSGIYRRGSLSHPVKYQILIEYDPETKSFGASVPGLPVYSDANSEQEALDMIRQGLVWYLEENSAGQDQVPPQVQAKLVTVEL